jgi:hypothetical protein
MKLSKIGIREKIIQALGDQYFFPELVNVFDDSFTYFIGSPNHFRSLYQVKYKLIMNELVINWNDAIWINRILL